MTPQEKNEAVARKLGLEICMKNADIGDIHINRDGSCGPMPDYCGSIAAAWEIVDKIPGFLLQRNGGHWTVCSYNEELECTNHLAWDRTAPEAIVMAFLKLNG